MFIPTLRSDILFILLFVSLAFVENYFQYNNVLGEQHLEAAGHSFLLLLLLSLLAEMRNMTEVNNNIESPGQTHVIALLQFSSFSVSVFFPQLVFCRGGRRVATEIK